MRIVGPNTLAATPVTIRLLGVERGKPPRAVHELPLRVREVQPDKDAVADDPAPGDEERRGRGATSRG